MTGSTADILLRSWQASGGERFGFGYPQFEELMLEVAASSHWGLARGAPVSISAQAEFLANIRARALVLAPLLRHYPPIGLRASCAYQSDSYGLSRSSGGRDLS